MENTTAQIVVDQCDTMVFSVVSRPSIDESHFIWGIYEASDSPTDVLDPAGTIGPVPYFVNDQYAGRTVKVTGLDPGKYYVRIHVWDEVSCTDNIEMHLMEVIETPPLAEIFGDSLCEGLVPIIRIVFTGLGPWDVRYTYGNESNEVNLMGIVEPELTIPIMYPLPVGETEFWIMEVVENNGVCRVVNSTDSEKAKVVIFPKPVNSPIYLKDGD